MTPSKVKIFEVGPRDGLQNEPGELLLRDKIELLDRLSKTGLTAIEVGSFVSPKWVPQMADSKQLFREINRQDGIRYAALTPNLQGLDDALDSQVSEIAVFGAASEAFSQKNINCSIAQSIERFTPVIQKARERDLPVRAYVSCVAGCPYQGDISAEQVVDVAARLYQLGCYEISLGDTIGVGTPKKIQKMVRQVSKEVPVESLAIHCHDTYGQALANIYAALQLGVSTVDSSLAGLGGCPYAKGASGNVATEDVLYMLQGMQIETGVDLHKIIAAGNFISEKLGRQSQSKVAQALSR